MINLKEKGAEYYTIACNILRERFGNLSTEYRASDKGTVATMVAVLELREEIKKTNELLAKLVENSEKKETNKKK